ncbi:fimbria/pilus outer membrane usher protein [Burkholderia sp. SRS-W-2-2016]|uniref:fimbria/pilus outer membrane usher protein n=1 Tax=Burkholderia sp. SRS-W-2-2016 TaxID=1926878 RepID=UPI0021169DF8|nr:fimbria/pilus outer membrane usher protein [Burkholderia sp. SRS-W-2-2016]
MASWVPAAAHADATIAQVQFDDQFLMKPRNQNVDVSRFEHGNPVVPGEYTVDLYVNGNWVGHPAVNFRTPQGADSATPCFDKALVGRLGLNQTRLTDSARAVLAGGGECMDLGEIVEGASVTFDMSDLRLDVSVPQASLTRNPQGYVSPEFWDEGVPSATLAYNFNSFRVTGSGYGSTQSYLGLNSGINIGSWHLRQNSAFTFQSHGPSSYQNIETYVQHDLPSISSQLTLGDAFTDGAVFDSIGIRGAQIGTDDRMRPDSQRGYAPVIRGVALTNARVTVSQNGNRLYETTVAPGAFEIDDLYATGYGGNLLVTVTEADGTQRSFTVPYASVVQLLRPGISRFNFAIGQIRDAELDRHPNILQGTFQYGINNLITGYAGVTAAEGYAAGLIGAAFNTPIGAVALDVTQANASIRGAGTTSGQSVRISYSKLLAATDTNFAVAAYRYSSSGFWGLRDAMLARDAVSRGQSANAIDRQRNQVQLTMNQGFGDGRGNAYVVGSTLSYWNRSGTTTQFQVGYNNILRALGTSFSYNLSLSRQRDTLSGQMNNQVFLSVSMPLGKSQHAPTLATSFAHDSNTGWSEQAMLTGTAGEDNNFSYGVTANHSPGSTVGGVNGQYRSPYATFLGSASTGSGYSQLSGGVSGAVVAHPGGITFANDLGDTVGVVEAKNGYGARVTNSTGVRIDPRGYAVIPYLMPYRMNLVDIDPKGLPLDVEFKSTTQQITPRANSVVMIHFDTVSGRAAVITARQPNGATLPFGANVLDSDGHDVGVIGQGSRIFVRGVADEGALTVKWGDSADQQCLLHYKLPPRDADKGMFAHAEAVCDVGAVAPATGVVTAPVATPETTPEATPAVEAQPQAPQQPGQPSGQQAQPQPEPAEQQSFAPSAQNWAANTAAANVSMAARISTAGRLHGDGTGDAYLH